MCGINDDNYYSTSYYIMLLWLNIVWCTDTSTTLQYMWVWTVLNDEICIMCNINYTLNACIKLDVFLSTNLELRNQWIPSVAHKWNTSRRQHDEMIADENVSASSTWFPSFLKKKIIVLFCIVLYCFFVPCFRVSFSLTLHLKQNIHTLYSR